MASHSNQLAHGGGCAIPSEWLLRFPGATWLLLETPADCPSGWCGAWSYVPVRWNLAATGPSPLQTCATFAAQCLEATLLTTSGTLWTPSVMQRSSGGSWSSLRVSRQVVGLLVVLLCRLVLLSRQLCRLSCHLFRLAPATATATTAGLASSSDKSMLCGIGKS
jgi:hypothetical protein